MHILLVFLKNSFWYWHYRICRPFVPIETLKYAYMYNTIVQPHFANCDVVWGNCNATLASKLQKLQNHAARILTFSSYRYDANADPLLDKLSWGNFLIDLVLTSLAIMVYKSLHNLVPNSGLIFEERECNSAPSRSSKLFQEHVLLHTSLSNLLLKESWQAFQELPFSIH